MEDDDGYGDDFEVSRFVYSDLQAYNDDDFEEFTEDLDVTKVSLNVKCLKLSDKGSSCRGKQEGRRGGQIENARQSSE